MTKRIGDLGEVLGGRQRSPKLLAGSARPYLRVANVLDDWIDMSDVLSMPFTDDEFERYSLRNGDILVNEGQSLDLVGRSAMYRGVPSTYAFQNTLVRFRAGHHTDPGFALLLFQYLWRQGKLADIASRTTSIAHLGASRFASLRVLIPPRDEQRRIAFIGQLFAQRTDRLTRLIDAKVAVKRGLTHRMFERAVACRAPRRGWRRYHLGDLFSERTEPGRIDLPLLSITADRGIVRREELDRRDNSSEDKRGYLRIAPGDIGYNTMRMWQGVSALSSLEGIVSPAYTICTPGPLIDGEFAAALFKLPQVVHLFRRYSQGLVDDTLSLKFHHFAQIRLCIPPIGEQRALMSVLTPLAEEISLLESLREAYTRQKNALLDKLVTGEIRLNKA